MVQKQGQQFSFYLRAFISDSDIMQPTPKDNLLDGIED